MPSLALPLHKLAPHGSNALSVLQSNPTGIPPLLVCLLSSRPRFRVTARASLAVIVSCSVHLTIILPPYMTVHCQAFVLALAWCCASDQDCCTQGGGGCMSQGANNCEGLGYCGVSTGSCYPPDSGQCCGGDNPHGFWCPLDCECHCPITGCYCSLNSSSSTTTTPVSLSAQG